MEQKQKNEMQKVLTKAHELTNLYIGYMKLDSIY